MLPFEFAAAAVFKEIFAFILSVIMSLTGIGMTSDKNFSPVNPETMNMQFSVFADAHIEFNPALVGVARFDALRRGLIDISKSTVPVDSLILLGDNTENGQLLEYITLFGYLKSFNTAPETLMAMGNHETFGLNHDAVYSDVLRRFTGFYNRYSGNSIDKPYYYKIIKGYYFIVLGTEEVPKPHSYAVITEAQLQWLDGILNEAVKDGKPVFVLNHHPFLGTHGQDHIEASVGEQSEELYDVISKYSNIFYFSGHCHLNFSELTHEETPEGVHLFALPSLGKSDPLGNGLQVEVYDENVVVRGRDFANSKWADDYIYTIPVM